MSYGDYILSRWTAASNDLLQFTTFTMEDFAINWHHRVVARKLMDVLEGRTKRLMIFQQPRTGKSELVTRRFPAFGLGHFPDKKFMVAAYGSDLANSFNVDCQKIMTSVDYQHIFPNTQLPSISTSKTRTKFKETANLAEIVDRPGS